MNYDELTSPTLNDPLKFVRWLDNLCPTKDFNGQDVRLLFSETEPVYLGHWFWTTDHHERIYLSDLRDIGLIPVDINNLPIAYYQ